MKVIRNVAIAAVSLGVVLPGLHSCAGVTGTGGFARAGDALAFDAAAGVKRTLTVAGQEVAYRAWEGISYVRNPVEPEYQSINVYVPEAYFSGGSVDGWTADTVPVFLPNQVGGYMPGKAGSPGKGMDGGDNAIAVALAKGYVVAAPGARGRTNGTEGAWTGMAPSAIVDLKAAVRWLHWNDALMPGDANRIVSNGTSAGGALSALLGATGNNEEYEPYLEALGAAPGSDAVWAVSSYCPITNLDNADAAYEWQLSTIHETKAAMPMPFVPGGDGTPMAQGPGGPGAMPQALAGMTPPAGGQPGGAAGATGPWGAPAGSSGPLSADQIALSSALKDLFPVYVNGLGLSSREGTTLRLEADGTGSFLAWVQEKVRQSAQAALDKGKSMADKPWVTVVDGKVTGLDWQAYLAYLGRKKGVPAFDGIDAKVGENNLFGTVSETYRHFTDFGMEHDTAGAALADAEVVRLMNPMRFISADGADTATHWRIRHGTLDSDTSLAVSAILALKLENRGFDVDYALPWDTTHSGDYDLEELFAWVKGLVR